MPQNLEQKIMLILDDCEALPKVELCKRIQTLISQEIDYLEQTHELSVYDIELIKSSAVTNFIQTTMNIGSTFAGEVERLRAYSYIQASLGYLRNKGLFKGQVVYKGKKR